MVNKRTPQQTKRSPVIAEPALSNRPKRNISPKSWDNSSVLSWREEQELKKALYASLHDVKRQNSDPGESSSEVTQSETKPKPYPKRSRSISVDKQLPVPAERANRRHSAGPSLNQKPVEKAKSEERELRSRARQVTENTTQSKPIKVETQISSMSDETSKDSLNSSASQETKRKFSAQRKFAQLHGCGYGYVYTPTTTPVKQITTSTSCKTPPVKVFPRRAKTEDFLTFLCLRGTSALPPHLDMYNFTKEDSNGADSSYPATPSNGRRPGSSVRESSPSSSSTSVSQDDGFCPISPLKTFITPTKKAARASAGTPEIARGLATRTRHSKNPLRTSIDITPKKISPIKRKSPTKLLSKGSPTKMAKTDRLKMKKKAVATLTSMDIKSRKKSLFSNEVDPESSSSKKKSVQQSKTFGKDLRTRLKRVVKDTKKKKKVEDFIASRLPPRKARHDDFSLYIETEDLDDSLESKSPSPRIEPEKRKRKAESRIEVDDEISLKVPIKQSRLFKTEMKVRKSKLKENIHKIKRKSKLKHKTSETERISTRSFSRQNPDHSLTSTNLFALQKLKKLKNLKQQNRDQKKKTINEETQRKMERKTKEQLMSSPTVQICDNIESMTENKATDSREGQVVRKKGRQPGKKSIEEEYLVSTKKVEKFPDTTDPASLVEALTFHPTEQEFSNPMMYLQSLSDQCSAFGMCKIVPPETWKIEGRINEDVRFVSQRQITNKLYQRLGSSAVSMESIQQHLESHGVIESIPVVGGIELDLVKLSKIIKDMGGMQNVVEKKKWQKVADLMGIPKTIPERGSKLYEIYCRFLVTFDTLSDLERQNLKDDIKETMEKKAGDETCYSKGKYVTLVAFNKMAQNIETAFCNEENISAEQMEKQYWDILKKQDRHVVVHSGHLDTQKHHCSGFSPKKDARNPWNMNKLHQKPGSVLQYLGPVHGVTVPSLHIGMLFSTSCMSSTTQHLPFIQYSHSGSEVVWYTIPQQENDKFNSVIHSYLPEDEVLKPNSLMIPPSELVKKGVSLSRCVQKEGEFVVVFPKSISSNICCGYNVSESVCYALPNWLSVQQVTEISSTSPEKEPFSIEELLCKIIEDPHVSKDLLSHALPVFQNIVDKEISLRTQLQEAGLKMSRRMYTNIGQIKTSPGGTTRCMDDMEEILTFCEASKKVCYLSMVLNEADDLAFRPEYGLQHIQKKRNMKSCVFMYRHSIEELKGMIFNATERLKSKESPESKRKRKSV